MKTASVREPSVISVDEVRTPEVEPGGILVRMHACGICGSDLEKVFGEYGKPSMRLGHEPAGVVIRTGTDVTGFEPGDRVFTHHHVPCYDCHLCRHGSETMCDMYSDTNLTPCGLSEEYAVPAWSVSHGGVLRIPDSMSFEDAAMIEPLACCIRAWKKFGHSAGDTAAILGIGPTGMMHAMLARSKKFSDIFGFDMNDFRIRYARNLGIKAFRASDAGRNHVLEKTGGRGVDVAIVATGSLAALDDAIRMTRRGGTVMMFGVPSRGATASLDMSTVYSKELSILTSYAASDADTRDALRMIADSTIDVGQLITHTYAIHDSQKAFDHARTGDGAMKIVIRCGCPDPGAADAIL